MFEIDNVPKIVYTSNLLICMSNCTPVYITCTITTEFYASKSIRSEKINNVHVNSRISEYLLRIFLQFVNSEKIFRWRKEWRFISTRKVSNEDFNFVTGGGNRDGIAGFKRADTMLAAVAPRLVSHLYSARFSMLPRNLSRTGKREQRTRFACDNIRMEKGIFMRVRRRKAMKTYANVITP